MLSNTYHVGYLPIDRLKSKKLNTLAKNILNDAESGKCHLVQRKIQARYRGKPAIYQYLKYDINAEG